MIEYGLVRAGDIVKRQYFDAAHPVLHGDKGVWLVIDKSNPPPSANAETQTVSGPDLVVGEASITYAYTVNDIDSQVLHGMVKALAYSKIVAALPEWKQRNLLAQQQELFAAALAGPLTAEQQAIWDANVALWGQVKAIRAASDQVEALVDDPNTDLATLQIANNQAWP